MLRENKEPHNATAEGITKPFEGVVAPFCGPVREHVPHSKQDVVNGVERPYLSLLDSYLHRNSQLIIDPPMIRGLSAKDTMWTLREYDMAYSYLCDLPNDHFNAVTVGIHSEQVMHQLLRYPFLKSLGSEELEKLKILISCHDLEKYPLNGERDHSNAHEEHQRAERWLRHFAPRFGLINDNDIELAVRIIHSEALSCLIKDVAPARPSFQEKKRALQLIMEAPQEEQGIHYRAFAERNYAWIEQSRVSDSERLGLIARAVEELRAEAAGCGVAIERYFKYAVTFYQCDCSSYSRDCISESTGVRGPLSVEFLFQQKPDAHVHSRYPSFEFDSERGRMKMRGVFEDALQTLERNIRS